MLPLHPKTHMHKNRPTELSWTMLSWPTMSKPIAEPFNFALPTTLKNKEEIIFLRQPNTPICDVETCRDNAIADWARLKGQNQRIKSIRKQAELLVKLKVVIHQAYEENVDESGIPICLMAQN